jgi:hypothetical protein
MGDRAIDLEATNATHAGRRLGNMTQGMAAQTASDLRALVSRRVGVNVRVVVLGSDALLVKALEVNGNTVLVDRREWHW